MKQYTKIEKDNFAQKDKRISALSFFSSQCVMFQGSKISKEDYDALIKMIKDKTFELTDELYEKYPLLEEGDEGMAVLPM
jgi:hypothetical protein